MCARREREQLIPPGGKGTPNTEFAQARGLIEGVPRGNNEMRRERAGSGEAFGFHAAGSRDGSEKYTQFNVEVRTPAANHLYNFGKVIVSLRDCFRIYKPAITVCCEACVTEEVWYD